MRFAAALALAILTLAACGKREQAAAPAAPGPAQPAGPLTYEKKTATSEISLKLPERVGQIPALYAKLFGEGRSALDQFAEGAVEEVEGLRAAGLPATPYARAIEYAVAAETPRLLGLTVSSYENTGGAHPNSGMDGLVWDKAANRVVSAAELFRADADLTSVDRALCEATRTAKRERTGEAAFSGEFTDCPPLKSVSMTLAPSTTRGKAGGLTVLFSPYQIGPYVEGGYEIDLPQAAFRAALSPAYAGEFEGAPPARPKGE